MHAVRVHAVRVHAVRVHAVLAPIAVDGTCLSLRVLRPAAHDLAALRAGGALEPTAVALLRSVLAGRLALLVSGGTGTGKTTLLNALLGEVEPRERIVLVEDSEELRPRHPHVVRLVACAANIEGAGGVPLRDLVRHALRMRPDRLAGMGDSRGQMPHPRPGLPRSIRLSRPQGKIPYIPANEE